MFPLLVRDGLRTPYFAICALFLSLIVLYLEGKKSETELETNEGGESSRKKGLLKSGIYFMYLDWVVIDKILKLLVGASVTGQLSRSYFFKFCTFIVSTVILLQLLCIYLQTAIYCSH